MGSPSGGITATFGMQSAFLQTGILVPITFDDPVVDMAGSDVTVDRVSGSSIDDFEYTVFQSTETEWNFVILPTEGTEGVLRLDITGRVLARNGLTESSVSISPTQINYRYQREVAPELEIILPDGTESDPYRMTMLQIIFQWTQVVTDFLIDDIELEDMTVPSGNTLSPVPPAQRYTLDVLLPSNESGTARVTVPALSATSTAGVPGPSQDVVEDIFFDTRPLPARTVTGITEICREKYDFEDNEYLNAVLEPQEQGGAFVDMSSIVRQGDYYYGIMQIQKIAPNRSPMPMAYFLSSELEGGSVLVKIDRVNELCSILKTWEYVTAGGHSLTPHEDGRIYFLEGSAYSSRTDDNMGRLFAIETDDSISDLGFAWRSQDPVEGDLTRGLHIKTPSPILSVGSKLNMNIGYGTLDNLISDRNDPSNLVDNWQWIEYSNDLNARLPVLDTNNRTGYDVLRDLSLLTASIIGLNNDEFFLFPREATHATLATAGIAEGAITTIDWTEPNVDFPMQGLLYIEGELFEYTGISGTQFTGVTRGQQGTGSGAEIEAGADIFFVNYYLDIQTGIVEDVFNDFNVQLSQHQSNTVELNYADGTKTYITRNQASIDEYGESKLERSLILDRNQELWAEWVGNALLDRFSNPFYRITITMKTSPYLQLGDVVLIKEDHSEFFAPVQIVSIVHNEQDLTTRIKGETFI